MKLYHGGYGAYQEFTVAENALEAIENIGKKINAPYLPITVSEVDGIDGYSIVPTAAEPLRLPNPGTEAEQPLRRCRKCEFTTRSQGELLQHYAKAHPKGG